MLRRYKQYFKNFSDKLLDKMRADIEAMKAFPFGKLEQHIISLMLTKWSSARTGYGEKRVAKVWAEGWARTEFHLMRTALCPSGGLPNDNDGLEGKNGAQKRDVKCGRA